MLREFLDTFDVQDGMVTLQVFIDYYTLLSSTINNDNYFMLLLNSAWNNNNNNEKETDSIHDNYNTSHGNFEEKNDHEYDSRNLNSVQK